MKRSVVIGAGLGGLAAALRIARHGQSVTVLEKNDRVGGKLNIWESNGYRFDTGPTLLTMPFILDELFAAVGEKTGDLLDIIPLDPLTRYIWPDGSRLDSHADPSKMQAEIRRINREDAEGFPRFMGHAEKIYEAAAGPFLFTPFMSLGMSGLLKHLGKLRSVTRIDAFRTLDRVVGEYFRDERIRQLFNRFATYNGSSPYRAPGTLAIIPYVEFSMGGWYIRGGMYRLAQVLEALARRHGVAIRTGVEVTRIVSRNGHAAGVVTSEGEELSADSVVCNADTLTARETLLAGELATRGRRSGRPEPSLAGFLLLLGVRKKFPDLSHHNIFFSSDYRKEFDELIRCGKPAENPTLYLSLSCVHDPGHAPPYGTNLFVLVNAPPLGPGFDWTSGGREYREVVLRTMAEFGVDVRPDEIEVERMITPVDFEDHFRAYRGSIYGTASNGKLAAFLRPPNRARELKGLYFVGGSAHPGGGIPLVLLSGKIVAGMVTGVAP